MKVFVSGLMKGKEVVRIARKTKLQLEKGKTNVSKSNV